MKSNFLSSTAEIARPTRRLTILAQDPSLRDRRKNVITAAIDVPNEQLSAGPRGYRVQIVDYDSSTNKMYVALDAAKYGSVDDPTDPFARTPSAKLLTDPRFHAQNAYAIAMRTLAQFERALGRRVSWSFGGHQLKIAPHAFAEANAYYSAGEEALLFGYFGEDELVFTSLSHDIVAHETTHALVDGLRPRYMEPSSPDQAAFHEGFADVVALLSVYSIPEVVTYAIDSAVGLPNTPTMRLADLTLESLKHGILLGLGEQFGEAFSGVHGVALRRSVTLKPAKDILNREEFQESHRRGEVLVAAMLHAFLAVYRARLVTLGRDMKNRLPPQRVAEEGADIADRMLTMAIRALDYMPPTDIEFGDYLSALLTSDLEIRPDDSRYRVREHLRAAFQSFGIRPTSKYQEGRWEPPLLAVPPGARGRTAELNYRFVHREAMQRDRDEIFRFLWDNRGVLGLCEEAYTEVGSVLPCLRVDQDGFTLRETVADYVQILTVRADELGSIKIPNSSQRIVKPAGLPDWRQVRLLGGGALIFDEFGTLNYHIRNAVLNPARQTRRLRYLFNAGYFDGDNAPARGFAELHMKGMQPELPSMTRERTPWL